MKIAVIPARKGSKRCPGKNTAIINGIPIAEHTIKTIINIGYFDKVIVSTDDELILKIGENYDTIIDKRDTNLASENSSLIDVIRYLCIKYMLPNKGIICLLPVTNPLRNGEDIKGGLNLFENSRKKNSVISVCELEYPIELTWRLNTQGYLFSSFDLVSTRKQDYSKSYRWNDGFVIDSVENFLEPNRNNFGVNPIPYLMPPERSFYIDYPWQLEIIKLIMENQNKNI